MGHARRHFPNRLRKHRRYLGYKQSDVAKKLGFHSTNRISRWEKGESLPSIINLFKLSILYKTLADQLYYDLLLEVRKDLEKEADEDEKDETKSG